MNKGNLKRWITILVVLLILVICIGVIMHLVQQAGFVPDLHNPHG